MTALSFDSWEHILREKYNVISAQGTAHMFEVWIEHADGSVVKVEIDKRFLASLDIADSDIEDFLSDKLDTSLLRDGPSSTERLGVVDGFVGFYDPTRHYGVVRDQERGAFYWSANPSGGKPD